MTTIRESRTSRPTASRTARSRRHREVLVRKDLDPAFYPDIFAFRKAVEDGTVDPEKGCRNMNEYFASVSHGQV